MADNVQGWRRREMLGAIAAAPLVAAGSAAAAPATRAVPSSGQVVPVVGLGTWITFNVGDDPVLRDECADVMAAFFRAGGGMIDSSPMYGSSQPVIGHGLTKLGPPPGLFAADKVWTSGDGAAQIERSRQFWGVPRFDLLQVHNLVDWERKLPLLQEMKAAGQLGHVGITTSEGRRHDEFVRVMEGHRLDFVQVTYNVLDREVEERILPLAQDRGIGVIVNRPFRQGALTRSLEGQPLPPVAEDLGCKSWGQLLLKFILAHPAVTCAIPATTRVDHVQENLQAAEGPLPDAALRRQIAADVEAVL